MPRFFLTLFLALSGLTATAQVSTPWSPADLPDTLTSAAARMDFLATHYWDKTDFSNPERVVSDSSSEQAFVDFANLAPILTPPQQTRAFEGLLAKIGATPALMTHYRSLAEKYLFAPFSPFVNEDVYLVFLRTLIAKQYATEWDVAESQRLALQATGQPMLDTLVTTSKGEHTTLTALAGEGEVLLFLFDPECETCHDMQRSLEQLPNAPRIIALYTGENKEAYTKAVAELPTSWTVVTPTTPLSATHLYNTQTRPALYLLRDGYVAWRGYTLPQN